MAYCIVVGDDNSLYGSRKEKIIQREKLVNKIWFLVSPYYNGHDMSKTTVLLRYLLPVSKEYVTETLVLSDERYEEYLKYELPINTNLSKEFGDIELNLTFILLDVDDDGNAITRVRKTTNCCVHVTKIPDWDSIIPDSSLMALDQRIIAIESQAKELEDAAEYLNSVKADNLAYNTNTSELQLTSNGKPIGDKVALDDAIIFDDDEYTPIIPEDSDVVEF